MSRLPTVGSDAGTWGTILNDYLSVEHNADGTLKKASDIVDAKVKANAAVPKTTTVNGHELSSNVTVSKSDVGLGNVTNDAQLKVSDLDTDDTLAGNSDVKVASQKAVKAYVDNKTRFISIKLLDDYTTLTTGDGKVSVFIPSELNGMKLSEIFAGVSTVSSSGTPTIQIRNVTDSVDMLSTRLTIDANEKTSATATAPAVINSSNSEVATGDELAVDVDDAGTGCKGLQIILSFRG